MCTQHGVSDPQRHSTRVRVAHVAQRHDTRVSGWKTRNVRAVAAGAAGVLHHRHAAIGANLDAERIRNHGAVVKLASLELARQKTFSADFAGIEIFVPLLQVFAQSSSPRPAPRCRCSRC